MKPYEVLEHAADYMDEHGQCKGQYNDEEGRVCARGAIRAVLFGDPMISRLDLNSWGEKIWQELDEVEKPLAEYLFKERPAVTSYREQKPHIAAYNDGGVAVMDPNTGEVFRLEPHPNMAEAMRLTAKQLRADEESS